MLNGNLTLVQNIYTLIQDTNAFMIALKQIWHTQTHTHISALLEGVPNII